nr:hypothetical protein GCM10025732_34130 [Glycomyces mayteni]
MDEEAEEAEEGLVVAGLQVGEVHAREGAGGAEEVLAVVLEAGGVEVAGVVVGVWYQEAPPMNAELSPM